MTRRSCSTPLRWSLTNFEIDSAYQGEEGLRKVRKPLHRATPTLWLSWTSAHASGWDGVETIAHLREADPNLQAVICTAYSDYSWRDIQRRLGHSDSLLILKKPFDNIEVIQLAHALSRKWLVSRQAEAKMADLDLMVAQRTIELREAHEHIERELLQRARAQEAFRIIFEASAISIALTDLRFSVPGCQWRLCGAGWACRKTGVPRQGPCGGGPARSPESGRSSSGAEAKGSRSRARRSPMGAAGPVRAWA